MNSLHYLEKREEYIEFLPVEPWYRFEFSDGSKLDYGGSIEDTVSEINRLSRRGKRDMST